MLKRIITFTAIVFLVAVSANAQKKTRTQRNISINSEQRAILSVKKLTLQLDLTKEQTKKVSRLYTETAKRRTAIAKRKKAKNDASKKALLKIRKESKSKEDYRAKLGKAIKDGKIKRTDLTRANRRADFETQNQSLDVQIDFQRKMKTILNVEQYKKFKRLKTYSKKVRAKKMAKRRKAPKQVKQVKRVRKTR